MIYSKTRQIFRKWIFNLEMARNKNKYFFVLESKQKFDLIVPLKMADRDDGQRTEFY